MPLDARTTEELLATSRQARLRFLRTELQIASTMLDLADSASDQETRHRRESAAADACNEVARGLDPSSRTAPLSELERAELTAGLDALDVRRRSRL
jgi:hypothetical protein